MTPGRWYRKFISFTQLTLPMMCVPWVFLESSSSHPRAILESSSGLPRVFLGSSLGLLWGLPWVFLGSSLGTLSKFYLDIFATFQMFSMMLITRVEVGQARGSGQLFLGQESHGPSRAKKFLFGPTWANSGNEKSHNLLIIWGVV